MTIEHVILISCEGVGHVIFNLRSGVGQSILSQEERVGHLFATTDFPNAPTHPPPPPIHID